MLKVEDSMDIMELKRQGYSIEAITRETGFNWRTVKKYIEHNGNPPRKKREERPSKLDPFKEYIKTRLDKYEELSAVKLYEEIREQGYPGKISILRDFVRGIKEKKRQRAVVRFETIPGEQAQFDFGHFGKITVNGEEKKLYAFVGILGYSRTRFARFVLSQDLVTVLRGLHGAFDYWGGIPRECLFDRMKTVALRGGWNDVVYHPRLLDFSQHYGFRPRVCRPYRPQTKGKVERLVQYVKKNFFYGRQWNSLEQLNEEVFKWCNAVNGKVHSETNEIPTERLKREKLCLLPEIEYDRSYVETRVVSRDCRIRLRGNKYSVFHEAAGKTVIVKIAEDEHIRIYDNDRLVGEHQLCHEKGKTITDPAHKEALWKVLFGRKRKTQDKETSLPIPPVVEVRPLSFYEEVSLH